MQQLFDDRIHPAAVGLALDDYDAAADPWLPLRSKTADVVARMRVKTVTRDKMGAKVTYRLTLEVAQPTLLERAFERATFEVVVGRESAAFGIVETIEASLRGRTFIGFAKRFEGDDGPVFRFHLTSDSAAVASVIQEIAVFEELGRK